MEETESIKGFNCLELLSMLCLQVLKNGRESSTVKGQLYFPSPEEKGLISLLL